MITTAQKADLLFKKYLGKGGTGEAFDYYNEPKNGRPVVYPSQIWSDYNQIPIPASPVPSVVEQLIDVQLVPIPGHTNSFSSSFLVDAIPFNFDKGGSYLPVIKKSTGEEIPFTDPSDWLIDTEAGLLTFYSNLPSGVNDSNPPSMSFWRYIGTKGGGGGGGGGGTLKDFMSGQIEYPTVDNIYYLVSNNPSNMTVDSMTISLFSGTGTASLKVNNIPITGVNNIGLTSIDTTYTPPGSMPVASGSQLTLELNDMSVGAGRLHFTVALTRTLTA